MGRPLKRRGRKAAPQCRFEVASVADLDAYKDLAERFGYDTFRRFACDLFEAVKRGHPEVVRELLAAVSHRHRLSSEGQPRAA